MNSPAETLLEVCDLSVVFPNGNGGLQALDGLRFSVPPQQFVCVLGPSGSGKSTLLRILAGLLRPTTGEVVLKGKPIDGPRRGVGVVFQDANLMPWRTVIDNIALPLEMGHTPRLDAYPQARELVRLVGLVGFEGWLPRDLSGGMAQRVAIARALASDPDLLLLDEPFGALDAMTRERMGDELLRIWGTQPKTVIMVTHSITEAIYLADRVLVLSPRPGKIRLDMQVDLPRPRLEDMRYSAAFGTIARRVRNTLG